MKKTIKFNKYLYLQNTTDAIEFIFMYQLTGFETGAVEEYKIKVSISGSLAAGWGFQIWSPQPEKDYDQIRTVLLYLAKDKIIAKVNEGSLNKTEKLVLLLSNSSANIPFDPAITPDLIGQEIIIEI